MTTIMKVGADQDNKHYEVRECVCRNCEMRTFVEVKIPIWKIIWDIRSHTQALSQKCEFCKTGSIHILPTITPYPTYRPGTSLTTFQKETRHVMRRWKNGWPHEKRNMIVQSGLVPHREGDRNDEDNTLLWVMGHSQEIPLLVFSYYWIHELPQYMENSIADREHKARWDKYVTSVMEETY